jgi:DNA-binding FrmR family transcriptional regulator
VAQQLQAVERAIGAAKKALIHEHLDHCLTDAVRGARSEAALAEFRDITKYLCTRTYPTCSQLRA